MKIEEFDTEAAGGARSLMASNTAENEQAWKVSLEEIKARNYNLDCKNPHIGEQEIHDPDLLLAQYKSMQDDVASCADNSKTFWLRLHREVKA
jgi:type I restriction enzyme M protein